MLFGIILSIVVAEIGGAVFHLNVASVLLPVIVVGALMQALTAWLFTRNGKCLHLAMGLLMLVAAHIMLSGPDSLFAGAKLPAGLVAIVSSTVPLWIGALLTLAMSTVIGVIGGSAVATWPMRRS